MSADRMRCQGRRRNGDQCRKDALDGKIYCRSHDPICKPVLDEQLAAYAHGKMMPKINLPPAPKSLEELRDLVASTISGVIAGEITHNMATAVVRLSKELKTILQTLGIEKTISEEPKLSDEELLAELEREALAIKHRVIARQIPQDQVIEFATEEDHVKSDISDDDGDDC